jgi:Kef-type K+ transport system membrane component KefB
MIEELAYIALLLLLAKVFEEVCQRLKQPSILGYIIAGILLGPSVLSLVKPTDAVSFFLQLGIIFLFFLIGFEEIDIAGLLSVLKKRVVFLALSTFLIPFALSMQFFSIYGLAFKEALAISSVFAITSLGVLAKVLIDTGSLKEPLGLIMFTSGAVVEFIGLLAVMGVGSIESNSLVFNVTVMVGLILLYFVIASAAGIYLVPRIIQFTRRHGRAKETSLGILIGVILLFVVAAEESGLHGAIGALLLGIALSPLSKEIHSDVGKGMQGLAYGFFVPIFFAGIGLYFDFSFVNMPIGMIAGVIFLCTAGKFFGGLVGGVLAKVHGAIPIGFGMMSKGAVDVALMLALLSAGMIDEQLFSLYTFSVILVILVFPPLLKYSKEHTEPPTKDEAAGLLTPSYARTVVSELKSEDIMSMIFDETPGDITLDDFARENPNYFGKTYLVFSETTEAIGTISNNELCAVPAREWGGIKVSDIMNPDFVKIELEEDITSILEKMIVHNRPYAYVYDRKDPNRIVGAVSQDALNRILFGGNKE